VAVPELGHFFGVWVGTASGNVSSLVFKVTDPTPVNSAIFSPLPVGRQALTVIPNGRGSATVTLRANPLADGDTVATQATPDPDARFLEWASDAAGDANPLSVMMHFTLTPIQDAIYLGTGSSNGWQVRQVRLVGDAVGRKIKLEFHIITDGFNLLEGWYLDDVTVLAN
jgi:hypothetical protein